MSQTPSTAAAVATLNAAILADLEELQSRGFGHPDGQPIMNRVKVALQQVNDLAGTPAPEPDPVEVQLSRLADQVEGQVHQRHFLFQRRRVAAPLAQALAVDHGVVAEAQQVFDQVVLVVSHGWLPHM